MPISDMDKCRGWNPDRSLHTELALKDVYNKKRLYSAIGFERGKERKVLNTVFLNYILTKVHSIQIRGGEDD